MTRMAKTAASYVLLIHLLTASTALAQEPSTPPVPRAGTAFTQVTCASLGVRAGATGIFCGRLSLPETPTEPSVMLSIPFVVLRAASGRGTDDPVLYLHGGPGIATLESVDRFLDAPSIKGFRETRDVVMFDQRGTGKAGPALCPDFDATLNRLGQEAPTPAVALEARRSAAAACRAHLLASGRDPASYNSAAIADDAEVLRRALGYRQWNLLATSYGSFPAFELARRHRASIRSMLLNSPFPPNSPNRAEQITATVESLRALQARCDADDACRAAYPDIRKDAGKAIAWLERHTIATPNGRITGGTFTGAVWNLLVRGETVPAVPELLKRAAAGDAATVRKIAAPFAGPHGFGTYAHAQAWMVNCHDVFPRPAAALVRQAMDAHRDLVVGGIAEEQDVVCDALQPHHAPAVFYSDAPVTVPALVYAGEYDPATPMSDAVAAMRMLPAGTLVPVAGASHAPMGADACTLAIAHDFVANPAVAPDTACMDRRATPKAPDAAALEALLKTFP